MKQIIFFLVMFFLLSTLPASATTREQECQSRKNKEVGEYVECLHQAEFLHQVASRRKSIKACQVKFIKEWRTIISKASEAGATCFDAPLESTDFDLYLRNRTNTLFALLGKSSASPILAKQVCRRIKSLAAGKYSACRFEAEADFSRKSDLARYNSAINVCEKNFSQSWKKIISETKSRNTKCLDQKLARKDYQLLIDAYSSKVASVLAGRDELESVAIEVTGSPLTLIAGGSAQTLTVKNTSTKATLADIKANFSGTLLDGKVLESGNTCLSLPPSATCSLTFTPGNTAVSPTDFIIQGNGTLSVIGTIRIDSPAPTVTPTSTATPSPTPTPTPSGSPTSTATPTPTPTPSPVTLSVSGSPLQLTVNGSSSALTITNLSATTAALNVASNFTATALDGNVTETGNTCANISPLASCSLTYTPGNTLVGATSFDIQGSNTLVLSASIQVISGSTLTAVNANSGSASGGTGVTLTGTGLIGATSVTFDGTPATSVNVINSTTVTAVTPAHAVGAVDIVINTPAGGATLTNGYTYLATSVGQSTAGGIIACLNGGLNNLIAASADNSTGIEWGGFGTGIGAGAQGNTDGASNTDSIVIALGSNGGTPYGAQLCSNYEVDSQGNTPCQVGNTCYNDWFLPASNNLTASGQLNCLYTNRNAIGGFASAAYWGSTEFSGNPTSFAWLQLFSGGAESNSVKNSNNRVRCVRAFTP